jgi:hypothetical protein
MEPNHYAVVTLDSTGVELRGWDFKKATDAKTFADRLRLKGLHVGIWARDEYGKKLAPLLPAGEPRPQQTALAPRIVENVWLAAGAAS